MSELARRFQGLRLPFLSLGSFPTPVESLDRLSRETGALVFVKRDDLSSSEYGGNKVRKLELLLARALDQGKRRIVTVGALGSHHALATTIFGRKHGLDVTLVLYPQPLTDHVIQDLLLDHAFGARLIRARNPASAMLLAAKETLRDPGGTVLVPAGGSTALGTIGHVDAGLELGVQVREGAIPEPEEVFVPFGTGGTAAGLALGLALAGLRSRVVAVRVVPAVFASRHLLSQLVRGAKRVLRRAGAALPRARVRLEIEPGFLGGGYGRVTEEAHRAVARFQGQEGIVLETTYTGKTAAALLERARPGRRLLFWNTFSSADLSLRLLGLDPRRLPAEFHGDLKAAGRMG